MSGGDLSTQIDRPYAQQPATRAAAARVISRQDQAELLLAMLGLVDKPGPLVIDGQQACPRCEHPLPDPLLHGGHRPCRRRACVTAAAEEAGAR